MTEETKKFVQSIVIEEQRKFLEENREIILERVQARLKRIEKEHTSKEVAQ